jgi:hypothetical protein
MSPEESDAPLYVPDENGPELPLPPQLPIQPFHEQECIALLDEIADNFPNPHDALEELMECGSSMFEDVEELLDGFLGGDQFTVLMPLLIQIAFVFAPPGTLQPELNLDIMEDAMEELLDDDASDADLLANCRQPGLMKLCLQTLNEFNTNAPRNMRKLQPREMAIATVLLRVVIDEFDSAMRLPGAAREE